MKLRILGKSQTVVEFESGVEVFFSYETPVAAFLPKRGYVKTDKKWSVTTSKHIRQYLGVAHASADTVPQESLDNLIPGELA